MPQLKPNASNDPVWKQFSLLKRVAEKAGVSTSFWRIEVPAKGKGIWKPWQLIYNPPGKRTQETVSLGTSAKEAAEILLEIRRVYVQWVTDNPPTPQVTITAKNTSPFDPPKNLPPPHRSDYHLVRYSEMVYDHLRDPVNKPMDKWYQYHVGRYKAGILDMSIFQYMKLGIALIFPIPPRTEKEWKFYLEKYNDYLTEKEKNNTRWNAEDKAEREAEKNRKIFGLG